MSGLTNTRLGLGGVFMMFCGFVCLQQAAAAFSWKNIYATSGPSYGITPPGIASYSGPTSRPHYGGHHSEFHTPHHTGIHPMQTNYATPYSPTYSGIGHGGLSAFPADAYAPPPSYSAGGIHSMHSMHGAGGTHGMHGMHDVGGIHSIHVNMHDTGGIHGMHSMHGAGSIHSMHSMHD